MRMLKPMAVILAALACGAAAAPAMDKDNPTCPADVDWGQPKAMTLTPADRGGKHVLLADGIIDSRLPERMKAALDADPRISEIWLKSRGGNAKAGNATGLLIRKQYPGMTTRIPSGWTCFSACNFVFMGGDLRYVDPGGIFMVHMFTHTTSERDAIDLSVDEGATETTKLIGQIEQSSAMLASADNDFLIRMGISRKLLTDIMYRQQAVATDADRSTRYCLSQDEVRKYNVMPRTMPAG
ncbi:hypothetical protein RXV95_13540 [Novosphingobium sp. ZN18A2]|uniref:COG3904 family protein n=1 Tax=Novosphingobium sp. ZN18A2 TaxID=3079861 RepID=UPI0030CE616D